MFPVTLTGEGLTSDLGIILLSMRASALRKLNFINGVDIWSSQAVKTDLAADGRIFEVFNNQYLHGSTRSINSRNFNHCEFSWSKF